LHLPVLTGKEPSFNAGSLIAVTIVSNNWSMHQLARNRADIIGKLGKQQV
jgi:hypothetical protein